MVRRPSDGGPMAGAAAPVVVQRYITALVHVNKTVLEIDVLPSKRSLPARPEPTERGDD